MIHPAPVRGSPEAVFRFRTKLFLPGAALYLLVVFVPANGSAVETPAAMLVDGRIGSRWSLPPLRPTNGDRVLAFALTGGQLLGQGLVVGSEGEFVVEIVQTAKFNGTLIRLELQRGRVRYQLLQNGRPAEFEFAGGILPRRLALGLRIGEVTALLPDTPAATQGPQRADSEMPLCDVATMDVNRDGVCDDADLAILSLFGAGVTRTAPAAAIKRPPD